MKLNVGWNQLNLTHLHLTWGYIPCQIILHTGLVLPCCTKSLTFFYFVLIFCLVDFVLFWLFESGSCYLLLAWNTELRLACIFGNPFASASWMPRLQVCTTHPADTDSFKKMLQNKLNLPFRKHTLKTRIFHHLHILQQISLNDIIGGILCKKIYFWNVSNFQTWALL